MRSRNPENHGQPREHGRWDGPPEHFGFGSAGPDAAGAAGPVVGPGAATCGRPRSRCSANGRCTATR